MDPLEQFWSDLFSENPALVVAAWVVLSAAEREAVEAHLRSIAADPVRLADQRRAAEYALAHRPGAPRLVLASSSPRRRELVSLLGFPFTTMAADVDESPHAGEDPPGMVARLSREKATAARSSIQTADDPIILLTADTTVSLDGQVVLLSPRRSRKK